MGRKEWQTFLEEVAAKRMLSPEETHALLNRMDPRYSSKPDFELAALLNKDESTFKKLMGRIYGKFQEVCPGLGGNKRGKREILKAFLLHELEKKNQKGIIPASKIRGLESPLEKLTPFELLGQVVQDKNLSPRELNVLQLMLESDNDWAVIQKRMDLSAGNLRKYRQRLYSKFNITDELGQPHDVKLLEHIKYLLQCFQQRLREQARISQAVDDLEFYISRPQYEENCLQSIQQPGALVLIEASKKNGKTFFSGHIVRQLNPLYFKVIQLSFNELDKGSLQISSLLKWFCASVCQQLDLNIQDLKNSWDEDFLPPSSNATAYFEQSLLSQLQENLVIVLDDIDRLFANIEVTSDFSALLRSWHDKSKRTSNPEDPWRKLRIIVLQSTDVYAKFSINTSPLQL